MDFWKFEGGTSTLFRNNGHQTATRSHIQEEQRSYRTSASNSHVRTLSAKVSEVVCCEGRISSDVILIQIVMEGCSYPFYIVEGKMDINTLFVNIVPEEESFGNLSVRSQIETFVFWDEVG